MCGSSAPSPPAPPPEPAPPPTPADSSVRAARSGAKATAAGNAGRAAAILTSPQGVVRPPNLALNQLRSGDFSGKQRLGQ